MDQVCPQSPRLFTGRVQTSGRLKPSRELATIPNKIPTEIRKAKEVVESLKDDGRFKQFKNYVFEQGLELNLIFLVMSMYLRDIALPLLGYRLDEVDKDESVQPQNNS